MTMLYRQSSSSVLTRLLSLFYISSGKYTFNGKGAKDAPVKGIDDKHQITVTSTVSAVGDFLPKQQIYTGKTKR